MATHPFKVNPRLFRELALSPEVRSALRQVAERAKETAEGLAEHFRITGEYAQSFDVAEETITDWHGQYKGPRAAARLENSADYAAAVEWGYQGRSGEPSTSAHRVLGRTLDTLGE